MTLYDYVHCNDSHATPFHGDFADFVNVEEFAGPEARVALLTFAQLALVALAAVCDCFFALYCTVYTHKHGQPLALQAALEVRLPRGTGFETRQRGSRCGAQRSTDGADTELDGCASKR